MPKKYSQEFLVELNTLDETRLGVQLAKACVNAELPITEIAKVFEVSRMTVHSWFRGSPIRDKNESKIKRFLVALDGAWKAQLENHTQDLPISEMKKARTFLETNIIPKIVEDKSI
jgi:predicted regulator of amino acid metabolism with ACT domain|tara:strand:- start:1780 stop:2127 length:348 start_codon:yes stop_codon:yes gene_type:complete